MPTPRFYQESERLCLLLDAEDMLHMRVCPLSDYISQFQGHSHFFEKIWYRLHKISAQELDF